MSNQIIEYLKYYKKALTAKISGHDDSYPYSFWKFEAMDNQYVFIKNRIVRKVINILNIDINNLPNNYSSADREQIGQIYGLSVDDYLNLKYVREFTKNNLRKSINKGNLGNLIQDIDLNNSYRKNVLLSDLLNEFESKTGISWKDLGSGEEIEQVRKLIGGRIIYF